MSIHRARLRVLLLVPFLAIAVPAWAWNSTGHQVVAEIAWKDLKPAARDKISALLKDHPHFARHLAPAAEEAESPDAPMRIFMRAATWPDLMRTARGKGEGEFHHAEWHFINFPIVLEGTDRATLEIPPLSEKLEAGKPPENVLQALEWSVERLKNPDVSVGDKAVALAWLEHLVGDVHQPLHTAAIFSAVYPKGDRGGNLFIVKHHGNVINLHSFWDDLLGGYTSFKLIDAVAAKVIEAHSRASLEKEVAVVKFPEWAAESFALARDVAYAGGKLKGVTRETSIIDKAVTTPELPEKYDETARDTARLRVALAGYRLADLLNRIFE